jgi:hypothetical protein
MTEEICTGIADSCGSGTVIRAFVPMVRQYMPIDEQNTAFAISTVRRENIRHRRGLCSELSGVSVGGVGSYTTVQIATS